MKATSSVGDNQMIWPPGSQDLSTGYLKYVSGKAM